MRTGIFWILHRTLADVHNSPTPSWVIFVPSGRIKRVEVLMFIDARDQEVMNGIMMFMQTAYQALLFCDVNYGS